MATKTTSKLSNNNYFIVLLLITLIVLGATVLGAKALVTGIMRDTEVYKAKALASDNLTKDLLAAPNLVDNYKALGSKQQLIADALPNTTELPGLMAMLENLSASSGTNLKSISPSQSSVASPTTTTPATGTVTPPKPQPYNVSLTFDGSYASLKQLLAAIEQSARPMRVTALQLSGAGNNLSVQMEATTYYQDKATLPISMKTVK
jgi:Tfp pilus assembly protein PilO